MGIAEALGLIAEGSYVQKTRKCDASGCYELTRENKPFCLLHIERTPYVDNLIRRMEEREETDEKVATDHRTAKLDSITALEILLSLRQRGTVTEDNLCRAMKLGRQTVHNYVLAMLEKKMVLLQPNKRGRTHVTLLDASGRPATPMLLDEDLDEDDDEGADK